MNNSIESIFDAIPVEESASTPAPAETTPKEKSPAVKKPVEQMKGKDMGDRVFKGNPSDRIEAFGEMLEDDVPAPKVKPHEKLNVEKDKSPISKTEKESVDGAKDHEIEEELEEEIEEFDDEESVQEDDETEIPKDKKFKVKVDGQDAEVTLEELLNGYSGKQAISKRFTELDKEKKAFVKEKTQILADQKYIQKEVAELKDSFVTQIEEFKKNAFNSKNPMGALDTLLDKLGVDSYNFNRAVFEYNLPEYEKFFEMSDVERDAYFIKKENDFFKKREQTFAERTQRAQSEQERQRQEFDLIKRAGLSIESYNSHFDELDALGADEISVEKVLEFAKVKPIMDKAGTIVAKTSKANDIGLIQSVSRLLMEFPNTTEEEIIEHIEGKAAAKKASQVLKGKENFTVDKKKVKKSSKDDSYFTDDEWEDFNSIRRR